MSATAKLIGSVPVANELGEGVIWDSRDQAFWWTDIQGSLLFRYHLDSEELSTFSMPERLACFARVEGKDFFIGGFASGFAYFDPATGDRLPLEALADLGPGMRLNDGRVDRQGRFWVGGMVEDSDLATSGAPMFCLNALHEVSQPLAGLSISNSLCWSPDGSTCYHTDTPTRIIHRYPFDGESGAMGAAEPFVATEEGCYPDGSCVDADGYLWNAQWGGSRVVRYAPDGSQDFILTVPVSQPSCAALGGPDLNILAVTTARQDMTAEALIAESEAGNLFLYETNVRGTADPEFKTDAAPESLPR